MKSFYKTLFLFLALVVLAGSDLLAQELFCRVTVINSAEQDKSINEDMARSITEFMNQRRRGSDQFAAEERILCNIVINVTESPRANYYNATAQIQAIRPVYGASLETVLINFLDKDFSFEYTRGQPMEFNDNSPQYVDQLTSLLSYYAYIIMGLDYDSFSKLGGKIWFQRAQQIALNAANVDGYKGWKSFEGTNNRNWLIENYMNQQLLPFREGLYNYHRLGLDVFGQDPEGARRQVLDMLARIKTVLQVKPLCIAINTFLDSKSNEIVSIFSQGTPQDKQAAYNTLVQIDPTKTERYQELLK